MKTSNQEMHPLHAVSTDDAIGMLIADHKRVAGLFAEFKRLTEQGRDKEKAALVDEICLELTVHTQLEEQLFYPAARKATRDVDQMDEALVEHAGAKQLIAQLQVADPGDDLYDAKMTVLAEQIDHHVQEEEGSMFPKVRYAGLDTLNLGASMLALKSDLLGAALGRAPRARRGDEADPSGTNASKETPNKSLVSPKKKPIASSKKKRR